MVVTKWTFLAVEHTKEELYLNQGIMKQIILSDFLTLLVHDMSVYFSAHPSIRSYVHPSSSTLPCLKLCLIAHNCLALQLYSSCEALPRPSLNAKP